MMKHLLTISLIMLTGCSTFSGSNRDIREFSVISDGCEQLDVYINKNKLEEGSGESKGTIKQQTTIGK